MSAEWLMSSRDTEVAADIERQIVRNKRDGGGAGRRFRMNYATGLALRTLTPLLRATPRRSKPPNRQAGLGGKLLPVRFRVNT